MKITGALVGVWDVSTWDTEVWMAIALFVLGGAIKLLWPWLTSPERRFRWTLWRYRKAFAKDYGYLAVPGATTHGDGQQDLSAFVRLSVVDAKIADAVRVDAFTEFDRRVHPKSPVHLFVLGRPGSGKSTLMRAYGVDQVKAGGLVTGRVSLMGRMAIWLERRARPKRVPMIVELADFAESLHADLAHPPSGAHLVTYLSGVVKRMGIGGSTEFVRRALKSGRLDVLLDGLDEVPGSKRDLLLRIIRDFSRDRSPEMPTGSARLLITCRLENFDALRDSWSRAVVSAELHLVPLRDAEIIDYVQRKENRGRAWTQNFLEAIRDPGTIDHIRFPLILARAVEQFARDQAVPSGITDFYDSMIRELLTRSNRGVPERDQLQSHEMLQVFQVLANNNARDMGNSQGQAFRYFTRGDLIAVCREQRSTWHRTLDDRQLADCADRLLTRSGLVMGRSSVSGTGQPSRGPDDDQFYFSHRSFHEYLVALHLATTEPQEGSRLLLSYLDDDEWHLIVRFFAARLSSLAGIGDTGSDVDRFLSSVLLEAERRAAAQPGEQSYSGLSILSLAGNCLSWTKASDDIAGQITSRLYDRVVTQIGRLIFTAGNDDQTSVESQQAGLALLAKAINALLSGLRSPRDGVRDTVRPIAEQLVTKIDNALSAGLNLQPEAAIIVQMIDGITRLRRGTAIGPVAQLIRSSPQHTELIGPLWRCLQAYSSITLNGRDGEPEAKAVRAIVEKLLTLAMPKEGFDELDAQPYLRRAEAERQSTRLPTISPTSIPKFMTKDFVKAAYPFSHGLPRDAELHPLVALLCWAHRLSAEPTPRNRLVEAMKADPAAYDKVEKDWRHTRVAFTFWLARTWSTLGLLASLAGWIALFTLPVIGPREIDHIVWVWALSAAALATIAFGLITRRAVAEPFASPPPRRRGRLLEAGAAPHQGESGSVIPEIVTRLLPGSLAQMGAMLFPVLLAVPVYWILDIAEWQFAVVVFGIGMLFVWLPALQAFDHGKRSRLRNRYLDIYEDDDSKWWVARPQPPGRSRQQAPQLPTDSSYAGADMRTWIVSVRSSIIYASLVLAALLWTLIYSDVTAYPSAIAVLGIGVMIVVLVHGYVRLRRLDSSVLLRILLRTIGAASLFTGLLLMSIREERLGIGDVTGLGAAAVFGGALVLYCAMQLGTEFDQAVPIQRPVESGQREGNEITATLHRFQSSGSAGGVEREVAICLDKLALKNLHYVAFYDKHGIRFSIDLLENERLRTGFSPSPVEAISRRRQYLSHGPRVRRLVTRFNEHFNKIESGDLLRVVLDVERGALYYFKVADEPYESFIIGVTLDQYQVHLTDQKLVSLVTKLREALGLLPFEELEGPYRSPEEEPTDDLYVSRRP